MHIKNTKDFCAGLIFAGFGLLAVLIARNYSIDTAENMGPGFFPALIGTGLIALGIIIIGTAFKYDGEALESFALRPVFFLSFAFAIFGLGLESMGLAFSIAAIIILCDLASEKFNFIEVIITAVALITGCWALFIWGLELPFNLF